MEIAEDWNIVYGHKLIVMRGVYFRDQLFYFISNHKKTDAGKS